jgi:1,4-alpha-glucan branching enzyme
LFWHSTVAKDGRKQMTELGKDGVVRFSFYRPGARQVLIATDLTDWQPEHAMCPQGNGWWTAAMALAGGEYRFRYLADGVWYADYASHGVEAIKTGGWNSVLVVPESEAHATEKLPG